MKENIVIIGAGGFGREVLDIIDRECFIPIGFIDPNPDPDHTLPLPVLGDDSLIPNLRNIAPCVCVAVGDVVVRRRLVELALASGLSLPPLIHRTATLLTKYHVGDASIIYPNAVVMSDCTIGRGVLLNTAVTLGHDVTIGDFSTIGPGAHLAGRITVGSQVVIGIGTCVREKVQINHQSIVGAGSVVVKDVPTGATVFGVPAQVRQ